MFRKIMVPVDLAHEARMADALAEAAILAEAHDAEIVHVGVTAIEPGPLAHNPAEYAARLTAFSEAQAERTGRPCSTHVVVSHDPAVDLSEKLLAAIEETGADLVVMATHRPGLIEHVFASHGGHVAAHAPVSVMLVR